MDRRRWALAVTSVSFANGRASVIVDVGESRLALYTKLPGVRCLIHVGREGARSGPSVQLRDQPLVMAGDDRADSVDGSSRGGSIAARPSRDNRHARSMEEPMTLYTSERTDRLVIYPSRTKMLLVLLGAIAFVVAGVWIASPAIARLVLPWELFIASYVGVPFFGACGLYAAYRLVRRRPALEIDSTGISDTASALGVGYLGWDEVGRVVLYKIQGQSMLGIFPKDLESVLSRQHPLRRKLLKLNLALGYAPVNIPQVVLRMKLSELAELLRTRFGVRVEGDA